MKNWYELFLQMDTKGKKADADGIDDLMQQIELQYQIVGQELKELQ
jgi:hypothetical protein